MSDSSLRGPDMAPLPPRSFGALLRRHRVLAGMTQEALAERAGLSARAIGDLECGVNRTPQPGTLLLLAEALQLSAEERAQFEAAARREKLERRPVSTPGASSDSDTASTASEIVAPLSFLALTGGEALLLEGV